MLPFTLHGYQTSVCTSIGATPFSLVYEMEAVLPFEVEVPSLRILAESGLKESEWAQACFDQLNLIEGIKEGDKWNFEVCLIRLSFIKVTTSVTHAFIYRLGSFLEKLS